MSNHMKYIKNLEAVGFERVQAEAQVQMVLDAIEGDLATKTDLQIFESNFNSKISILKEQVENRFLKIEGQIREMELRLITRLGFIMATITSLGVAVLTWLIKV